MSGSQTWTVGDGRARPAPNRRRPKPPGPVRARLFQGRIARPVLLWWRQVRAALGIRRGVRVEDFYYKELTPESLQRALSKRGRGSKKYRVTFPDGAKLVVKCSSECIYADLMGPLGLQRYHRVAPQLRPGRRVLEAGSSTGYRAAWLAQMVGPSGAVVALEEDATMAEFAARRYALHNVSFEHASLEALIGETNGAFDAVLTLSPPAEEIRASEFVRELWRVLAPGGTLLVGADPTREPAARAAIDGLAATFNGAVSTHGEPGEPREFILTKPIE